MPTLAAALTGVGATLACLALLRGLFHRGVRRSLAAPRIPNDRTPADAGLDFETVRIGTRNGRWLHGWLVAATAGSALPVPAAIVIHGWGGNAATMLPLARPLYEAGFAVLFVDARCHGASDDDGFASLPRFAEDLECALAWLATRKEIAADRVALIGHSVGAGAVLLTASRRPDVRAAVSVAAFAHPAEIMRDWLAARRIPPWPVGRYVLAYVQRVIGCRFDDIAPVNTIARVRCPVLLVHGSDDSVVPLADALRIHDARTHDAVELLVIAGKHDSFADLDLHLGRLVRFLRDSVSPGIRQRTRHADRPARVRDAAP